jgi:hypothetical protein
MSHDEQINDLARRIETLEHENDALGNELQTITDILDEVEENPLPPIVAGVIPIYVTEHSTDEGPAVGFSDNAEGGLCLALRQPSGALRVVWCKDGVLPEPQVLVDRPELRDFANERALVEALWAHRTAKAPV